MRYGDQQLRELLAREYVLGTLHGAARRRFERLLKEDAALRDVVAGWERRLNPLAQAVRPREPPARVWREIERRIAPQTERRFGLWHDIRLWRGLGLAASAAAVMLALYIGLALPPAGSPTYIVVLANQQQQAAWIVNANMESKQITVRALRPQSVPSDKAYELWVLPGAGRNPRSLGMIPVSGSMSMPLSMPDESELMSSRFAVSLEPSGGSPTGLPTGPVMYQGQVLTL